MKHRMSEDDGGRYHPEAVSVARMLEHAGYIETPHKELDDQEDVIAVDGRNGNVAPVRHHRKPEVGDDSRLTERHIVESYPDSAHAERMDLKHAYAESAQGEPFSRMAFFRMTSPDHAVHGRHLYAARDAKHREGS